MTKKLILVTLVALAATAAPAGAEAAYVVEWSRSSSHAAVLGTYPFDDPEAGPGLFVVGSGSTVAYTRAGERWRTTAFASPSDAAAADFTGDGVDDLAIGTHDNRLGFVDGRTGATVHERVFEDRPGGLAVGDATGDGRPDLFVMTEPAPGTRTTTITLIDGTDFAVRWTMDTGDGHYFIFSIDSGDLDGDGLADLVYGTLYGTLRVYAVGSDGARLWQADLQGAVSNVVVADGGGTVFASRQGNLLASLDGRTGAVRWTLPYQITFSRLAAADLDGDGAEDAVWVPVFTSGKNPIHRIIAVDGETGIPMWTETTMSPPKFLAVGDVDGDGDPDVVVSTEDIQSAAHADFVWTFDGATGRTIWVHPFTGEQQTALGQVGFADVHGDARMEVVVATYDDNVIAFDDRGRRVWSEQPGSVAISAIAADLDGNGTDEVVEGGFDFHVVARSGDTGVVRWRRNLSGEVTAVSPLPAAGATDVLVIALSQVCRLRGSDGAEVWCHRQRGWATAALPIEIDGRSYVVVGARGLRAMHETRIVPDTTQGSLSLLDASTGALRWTTETVGAPWPKAIADVDADGIPDLLTASLVAANGIVAYRGDLLESAAVPLWRASTEGPVEDLVVDGGRLLVVQAPPTRAVSAHVAATGAEVWKVKPDAQGQRSLGFTDLNGDGALDALLATGLDVRRVTAISGTDGSTLLAMDPSTGGALRGAAFRDVSGDGIRDLVVAGRMGVFAYDGAALPGRALLWSHRRVNALGIAGMTLSDGARGFLAFGHGDAGDRLSVLRPT